MLALAVLSSGVRENNKRYFKIYSVLLPICIVALAMKVISSYSGGFRN